jgi:hypothetical protein
MGDDKPDSLSVLSELDTSTTWELPRELLEDEDGDDSMVDLSDGELDGEEEVCNILDCIDGMNEEGQIEDVLCVINTTDDEQIVFTTLEDNQLVMGTFVIAMMNWWNTQRTLQHEEGGDELEQQS